MGRDRLRRSATCNTTPTAYYGNEASTTTFYASAALVITVPPADERDKTRGLTADRVHVTKVPSKPKPTPAWAKAKDGIPKAKRPASGATPNGRPGRGLQRRATVDKASYAEPEVIDDSEDDSEAEDGTKIKPRSVRMRLRGGGYKTTTSRAGAGAGRR